MTTKRCQLSHDLWNCPVLGCPGELEYVNHGKQESERNQIREVLFINLECPNCGLEVKHLAHYWHSEATQH